ncbi:Late embryogenesis abundant protein Lea14-A [Hordeum vulgare]|nr:Late embryogenesis abundant protein Lea14-A [Hordeum vulgare]
MPKPEATLDKVSFKGMTREAITMHSHVNVTNPYCHCIPICDIAFTLKCDGKEVASRTIPDPGWIEDSGEVTKMEVPAKLPYDFLISLIKDLGREWDIDYELLVKLTIDLPISGNFTIPNRQPRPRHRLRHPLELLRVHDLVGLCPLRPPCPEWMWRLGLAGGEEATG